MSNPQCIAYKLDGSHCQLKAMDNLEHCFKHADTPAAESRRAEVLANSIVARKKQVENQKKHAEANKERAIAQINTLEDVRLLYEEVINDLRLNKIDSKVADSIVRGLDKIRDVLKKGETEKGATINKAKINIFINNMTMEDAWKVAQDPNYAMQRISEQAEAVDVTVQPADTNKALVAAKNAAQTEIDQLYKLISGGSDDPENQDSA